MPRTARRESESETYHVTIRGAGRRRIFEDDEDRLRFLVGLRTLTEKDDVELLAWCLMDNHIHVLAKATSANLSKGFHRLATSYARYFNGEHGHVGPVFQNRFDSLPVETDAHLLATVRYIHLNPLDLGITHPGNYAWSSYEEYVAEPRICNTATVLGMLGGKDSFVELCDPTDGRDHLVSLNPRQPRLSDTEAENIAVSYFGKDFSDKLSEFDKGERDRALHRLKTAGLTIRQIERLTGIGRGIVMRA